MQLTSQSFSNQQFIPSRYAFGKIDPASHITLADNLNPHLAWEFVPHGTQSLVLMCHDPDVPAQPDDVNQQGRTVAHDAPRTDFYHWVLVDIQADVREIAEGAYCRGITPRGKGGPLAANGTRQGINDYTGWFANDRDMSGDYFGYDGPCPPWNDARVHRYLFTVYALNLPRLPLEGTFGGAEVMQAIQGHVIALGQLTGLYTLNPALNPK